MLLSVEPGFEARQSDSQAQVLIVPLDFLDTWTHSGVSGRVGPLRPVISQAD